MAEFLDPENIPMRNIFKKFRREAKIQGVVSTLLTRFRLAKYLRRLQVKRLDSMRRGEMRPGSMDRGEYVTGNGNMVTS